MKKRIIYVLLLVISALLLLSLIVTYVNEYSYKYAKITNISDFFKVTVLNISIASLPFIGCIFFLVFKKKTLFLISYILFFPLIVLSFVRILPEFLYLQTVCSYTEDVDNFGHYDKELAERLEINGKLYPELELFPNSISKTAKDVRYEYFYQNAASPSFSISLSCELDTEEFQAALKEMAEYESKTESGVIIYQLPQDGEDVEVDPFFLLDIWFDQEGNRVCYFLRNYRYEGKPFTGPK